MKKIILLIILFYLTNHSEFLYSQKSYIIGTETGYLVPIGELSNRFQPTINFALSFGYQSNPKWIWFAKIEYFEFNKVNYEKQNVKRNILVGSDQKLFTADLNKLDMELKITGFSINAKRRLFEYGIMNSSFDVGFGVFRWIFNRAAYDSIFVDTSSVSGSPKYYTLYKNVPSSNQNDWSGGFQVGIELGVKISENFEFAVSGSYKSVLGELWQALAFDMENVSTFQMLNLSGRIRIRF